MEPTPYLHKMKNKSQSKILPIFFISLVLTGILIGYFVLADGISINEDSEVWTYTKNESTKINYYLKDLRTNDTIPISYESFLNEENKFGFVFDETNINSEFASDISLKDYSFDKRIYYEVESDKNYIQHSKNMLSRELGKTKTIINEIGQTEHRPLKRFIDFSEIFTKFHNLYWYNTTERNVTICDLWDEKEIEICLKSHIEPKNITIIQKRDIGMKMYLDISKNWIIEFYNLFDLDPTIGDDTDSNWDLGEMTNMEVEGSGAGANLTSNASSGSFLSRIFDTGGSADWKNITYNLEYPYGEEIDYGLSNDAWFNKNGIVLNLHLNNDASVGENTTYAYDYSSLENHGTITGADWVADGIEFESNQDGITTIDTDDIFPIGTIVFLYKQTNSPTYHYFFSYAGDKNELRLNTASGNLYLTIGTDSAALWGTADDLMTDGDWHTIMVTWNDGDDSESLYIDGNFQSPSGGTAWSAPSNGKLFVGGVSNENDRYAGGIYDYIYIFNRSISSAELENIHHRGMAKLNVSTRSCDDASCSGESWNETDNNASFGRYNTLTDSNNRYFQYMFNYTNSSDATVRIENITIGYDSADFSYNLSITDPTTSSPDSVNSGDNITITFDFLAGENNQTTGVTMNNVTIGGSFAEFVTTATCTGTLDCTQYSTEASCNNCSECKFGAEDYSSKTLWTEDFDGGTTGWALTGEWSYLANQPTYCINDANDDCVYTTTGAGDSVMTWNSAIDLSHCKDGSAGFNVTRTVELGTLEADDCLKIEFYDGNTWGDEANVFCDDSPSPPHNIAIPDSYLVSGFQMRFNSYHDADEQMLVDGLEIVCMNGTAAGCSNDGACSSCSVGECDTNCSTAGCSQGTTPQFVYVADVGWQINVTVPDFASGLKDLFVNATYSGNTENDTETEAINYGTGEDTCTYSSGNWEVDCSDNCVISSDVNVGVNNIVLSGTGSFYILANITTKSIAWTPTCKIINVPNDGNELRVEGG